MSAILCGLIATSICVVVYRNWGRDDQFNITTRRHWTWLDITPRTLEIGERRLDEIDDEKDQYFCRFWQQNQPADIYAMFLEMDVKYADHHQAALCFGWIYNRHDFLRKVWAPTWVIIAINFLPLTVISLRFGFRPKRTIAGLCTHCGYDLRATPARCPECGRAR